MSDILDDALVAEARKQGLQPGRDAMKAAALAFAGSRIDGDFIVLPAGQSIHVRDAVKGLHSSQPEAFSNLNATDEEPQHRYSGMTAEMISENRQARTIGPVDQDRYTGLTRAMIQENLARKTAR